MLEDGITPFISVDMNDSCFLQPYVIISANVASLGGAQFVLEFKNFKRVFCWIYPLGWKNPHIRFLAPLDSNGNPIFNLSTDVNIEATSPEIDALIDAIEKVESGDDYFKERDELIDINHQ
ncbi:unnamed protein product [marine sediment metagenome]|uniref:Uncharacterized protein n=1 Tax=marine sediment metagenome TaxID=412755 RepID=X1T208_9ZZZZ